METIAKDSAPKYYDKITARTESCLAWVRTKRKMHVYSNAEELAVDYGKRGTVYFFPLSSLVSVINLDERFKNFVLNQDPKFNIVDYCNKKYDVEAICRQKYNGLML